MNNTNELVCIDNDVIQERLEILKRQTSYSDDEAIDALKKHNYDTMSCIREYLEIPTKKKEEPKKMSVNQQIYRELRHQLGTVTTPVYDPNA